MPRSTTSMTTMSATVIISTSATISTRITNSAVPSIIEGESEKVFNITGNFNTLLLVMCYNQLIIIYILINSNTYLI